MSYFSNIQLKNVLSSNLELHLAVQSFELADDLSAKMESQRSLALQCLEKGTVNLGHKTKQKTVLINYHSLQNLPDLTCSVAHTSDKKRTFVAAGLLGKRKIFQGLGVDVEFANRKIKHDYQNKFLNSEDHPDWYLEKNLILAWITKEACFKAFSNASEGKIRLLKEVTLTTGVENVFRQDKGLKAVTKLSHGKTLAAELEFFQHGSDLQTILGCAAFVPA